MKLRRNLLSIPAVLLLAACATTTTPEAPQAPAAPSSASTPITTTPPASHSATPPPRALAQIADEGTVTYSLALRPGSCHARDSGRLPDPACTPGSTDPAVTQATIHSTICVTGWTATVRPPSAETTTAKYQVAYPAYGDPRPAVSELDHLVPLELGGSNDVTNLWPEPGTVPNAKDPAENDLRADVCAGELTLPRAQAAIAADWETVP